MYITPKMEITAVETSRMMEDLLGSGSAPSPGAPMRRGRGEVID